MDGYVFVVRPLLGLQRTCFLFERVSIAAVFAGFLNLYF